MERMLVVVFDDEVKAYEGKSALRQLEIEAASQSPGPRWSPSRPTARPVSSNTMT